MAKSKSPWVKTGRHKKLDISITRHPLEDAGSFTGGGFKTVWHTTEGGTVDTVVQTLAAKRAAVHFVIDPHTGKIVQCVPLNHAGRGLEHTLGPETNRANAIQIEICGFAAQSGDWGDNEYQHLAALALVIERHVDVPRRHKSFSNPKKFSADGFVGYAGHCGHVHVPGNSHWDPGPGFKGRKLLRLMGKLDK